MALKNSDVKSIPQYTTPTGQTFWVGGMVLMIFNSQRQRAIVERIVRTGEPGLYEPRLHVAFVGGGGTIMSPYVCTPLDEEPT